MGKGRILQIEEHKSILFWLVMSFTLAFMFIAPFYKGLFNGNSFTFERPIYTAVMWGAITLSVVSIYFFLNWRLKSHRDVLAIAIWLIPLCYLVSMWNAASLPLAKNELYIQTLCALFFLIGTYFTKSKLGKTLLHYGLVLSGYVVILYGWMNWLGNANYQEAILNGRMAGVFQYPNTYAAFLIAILMICLLFVLNSKKRYVKISHSLMVFPTTFAIILTVSRGGYVTFAIVLLLFLLLFHWKKQLLILLSITISIGISFLLYEQMTSVYVHLLSGFELSLSIKGWFILVSASIMVAALIYASDILLLQRRKINENETISQPRTNWFLPVILLIIGVIGGVYFLSNKSMVEFLPENLQMRVENLSTEALFEDARFTYIKDSIGIIKDYTVLGAGGGAWSRLYSQYQSYPYTSNQTHTFYMKYLIETGILGFLVFATIVGYVFVVFIRNRRKNSSKRNKLEWVFPIFVITILSHSILDFDMSFVYLIALVFLSLGAMISDDDSTQFSAKKNINVNKLFPIFTMTIAVIVFIYSMLSLQANKLFAETMVVAKNSTIYNEIAQPLNLALEIERNHPEYNAYKISLLLQLYLQTQDERFADEATGLLEKVQKLDPYNRQAVHQQLSLFISTGRYDQAIEWVESNLEKFPWDTKLYENAIKLHFELGNRARINGDTDEMELYWSKALEYLSQVEKKNQQINDISGNQQEIYKVPLTVGIRLSVGKIYYAKGNYAEASEFLNFVNTNEFQNEANREIARWYLASLQKQNTNNKFIFHRLIESYPDEEQKIQAILKGEY